MKRCEVKFCFKTPVERCHIRPKGAGGSNKPHNIIHLCIYHHRGAEVCQEHQRDAFAKAHGFVERFKKALDTEYELEREKRFKIILKRKKAQAERKRCGTCNRFLPRGFKPKNSRDIQIG